MNEIKIQKISKGSFIFARTDEKGKVEKIELTVEQVKGLIEIIQAALLAESFVFIYQA